MNSVSVEDLAIEQNPFLEMTLLAGRGGLRKRITQSQVQKMGLALTGFVRFVNPDRIQILGNTEITYFQTLPTAEQEAVIDQITGLDLECLVVTCGLQPPERLVAAAEEKNVPVFQTPLMTLEFIERATEFLEARLAATTAVHGVLIDVFGVGVLLLGRSGIGKSECALDLILRGHRLVADDMVHIEKRFPSSLYGSGFEMIQHHMEIRGLGIINIRSLFGVEAIRERKKIELVLELIEWDTRRDYDRLGFEEEKYRILEVDLPMMKIPVTPARNLSTIIEVAARNHRLKMMGYHSALEFEKKLLQKLQEKGRSSHAVGDEVG
jgi:HPr kinase/phosphorylase